MDWLFRRLRRNSDERSLALNFLKVLQWASARQQLTLEEWNDEFAAQATDPMGGDEIFNPLSLRSTKLTPRDLSRLRSVAWACNDLRLELG